MLIVLLVAASGCSASRSPSGLAVRDRILPATCWDRRPAGAVVDVLVLHFSSAVATQPDDPYNPDHIIEIFKQARVSAHYMIDRRGEVLRLVQEADRARHAGRGEMPHGDKRKDVLNDTSLGIELVGTGTFEEMRGVLGGGFTRDEYERIAKSYGRGFTDEQYASLSALIDRIRLGEVGRRIAFDRCHIIGHSEYSRPGTRDDPKHDPGALFDWKRIGLGDPCRLK